VLFLTGLVTALNLLLSLVVGVRLLARARDGWPTPELSLAIYFLVSAFLGTPPQILVYGGMGDPRLAVAELVSGRCSPSRCSRWRSAPRRLRHLEDLPARAHLRQGHRRGGLHPPGRRLRIEALFEGFAPVMFAGVGHWIGWAGRTAAALGIAFESFRYWRMLRRRLRLGLADPVVTNRFLLWGIWARARHSITSLTWRREASTGGSAGRPARPRASGCGRSHHTRDDGARDLGHHLFPTFFPSPPIAAGSSCSPLSSAGSAAARAPGGSGCARGARRA
jgi:hypothetical protein